METDFMPKDAILCIEIVTKGYPFFQHNLILHQRIKNLVLIKKINKLR
jgi:hypothetical protein